MRAFDERLWRARLPAATVRTVFALAESRSACRLLLRRRGGAR